jgi:UDP-4-amino-4,6-dideoxy-N-acetyl-beta-L-altrosamine transaminase
MEQLAIKGGNPVRKTPIYYGRQHIEEEDINAVTEVLKSDFLTCGPKINEFEKALCEFTGVKYAVAVSSGTAALHIACLSAGITEGDEVITTPITFAASANCVLYCGATPVFADINPLTYNISPKSVREKITSKTKAIIAVDFTGQAVELDEIKMICKEHRLIFIEDAAHSIGTKYNNIYVGNIADMTTFSFHPVKTITGGEGGAITTNSFELYQKLILFRTHGITRNEELMINESEGLWYYEQIELGYNYRITDFQSALLISQLKKLPLFSKRRKEIVKTYNEAFVEMPEIILQEEIAKSDTTPHLYIIQLDLSNLSTGRKEIFDALCAENICPNVHYIPVYYFPYYQKLGYRKGLCPNAEYLYERILSLPLYYSMSNDDVNDIIDGVKKVIEYYRIKR